MKGILHCSSSKNNLHCQIGYLMTRPGIYMYVPQMDMKNVRLLSLKQLWLPRPINILIRKYLSDRSEFQKANVYNLLDPTGIWINTGLQYRLLVVKND